MPARMCYRNIVLCVALAFWAACNNDSSSNTAIEISVPDEVSSSSEVVTEISSSSISSCSKVQEASSSSKTQEDSVSIGISSSSKNQESSSSSEASSSSEISSSSGVNADYPYTLWLHPSVHCWDTTYINQVSCSSFRPELQMDKSDILAALPPSGESLPSYCMPGYLSVYVCENRMIYPKYDKFSLIGDTIVQCSADNLDGGCEPAEDACAKKIEDAEASTEYPYMLKKDLSVNCKEMYKMELDTGDVLYYNWPYSGRYEWLRCTSYYLCEDGNSYEYEDMLQEE